MIPKNIFQTYASDTKMPGVFAANVKAIKERNPGWSYTLCDDNYVAAFVARYAWPDLAEQYSRLTTPITRTDVFKYLLMYVHGGVYLDIKSTAVRPLDMVLTPSDNFIISGWADPASPSCFDANEYMQWFIISAPKHPYLKAALDQCVLNIKNYKAARDGVGKPSVLALTGPHAYTKAIRSIESPQLHRRALYRTDLRLRYTILANADSHQSLFKPHYSENTLPLVN